MPAIEAEVEAALEEGVKIEYLVAPARIISEDGRIKAIELIRTKLDEPDASGRRRPVFLEGTEFMVELDSLIPAVSQEPDLSLIPDESAVERSRGNTIEVDSKTYLTRKEGVFACGDAVTGPADVTVAMASARIAAESIHKYLRGEKLEREYKPLRPAITVEPIEMEEEAEAVSRPETQRLPPEERRGNFEEVELEYTKEMAVKEAKRCLRCDWEVRKLERGRREQGGAGSQRRGSTG
jgi:NADH-quinone oxidoreductase subunit F